MTTAQQFPQFTFEDFLDYEDAYGTPFELSARQWHQDYRVQAGRILLQTARGFGV